jgi:hypothetical protein
MLAVYMFSHDPKVAIVSSSSSAGLYPKENTGYLQNPLKPAFPRAPNMRKNRIILRLTLEHISDRRTRQNLPWLDLFTDSGCGPVSQ